VVADSHSRFLSPAPAPPAIYTLALHDALPISRDTGGEFPVGSYRMDTSPKNSDSSAPERSDSSAAPIAVDEETVEQRDERFTRRSEEHTSELQSRFDLVCRLLLDKNKGDTDLS